MSFEIVTIIEPPEQLTTVIEVGQGPAGPRGIDGVGDLNRIHTQGLATDVWSINHGLGKYPSVSVVDSAGDTVEGAVNYIDLNNLTITFSAPFGGRAFLN